MMQCKHFVVSNRLFFTLKQKLNRRNKAEEIFSTHEKRFSKNVCKLHCRKNGFIFKTFSRNENQLILLRTLKYLNNWEFVEMEYMVKNYY